MRRYTERVLKATHQMKLREPHAAGQICNRQSVREARFESLGGAADPWMAVIARGRGVNQCRGTQEAVVAD